MAARTALGFVETRGLVGVIEAADTAAKAAEVELLGFQQIGDGLVSVRFRGDVASVQAAMAAAVAAAERVSSVVSYHVIPAPHGDLKGMLTQPESAVPARPAALHVPNQQPTAATTSDPAQLQQLSVARLRQLVRQTPGTSLQGRQVSRANKAALIRDLQQALGLEV